MEGGKGEEIRAWVFYSDIRKSLVSESNPLKMISATVRKGERKEKSFEKKTNQSEIQQLNGTRI